MNRIIRLCFLLLVPALLFAAEPAEDILSIYGKAQAAYTAKDFAKYLQLAEKMLQMANQHSGLQFQYARALAANGKNDAALEVLKRVGRMGGAPPAQGDEAFAGLKDNAGFKEVIGVFQRNREPRNRSKIAFVAQGKDLIPEGIACDSVERKCYVGSIYRRKILVHDESGTRDFTKEKQDGLWGVLGMEVDAARRHLWVATANGGAQANMSMMDPDPETVGRTAIFKYDLRTGKLLKKYEPENKGLFFNDVALAPNGDVYISESNTGEIHRINAGNDRLERIVEKGTMNFPNGLAVSPDGKLVFISHMEATSVLDVATSKLQRIESADDIQTGSFDGMIFYNNSLIGIQGLTGGVDRVVRLHLRGDLRGVAKAEPLEVNHPLFVLPTTGDMLGDEYHYIANSHLRSFDEKGVIFPAEKLQDPVILKIDLLDSERAELLQVHEDDRKAHMSADAKPLLARSPDEFVTVNSGKIARVTPEQEQQMFQSYFDGAKYSEWNDLEPPIVHVSNDGNSGWMITRIRSKRTQAGKDQEFVYAGIMTYEKRDGKWIRTANVSTFER